MTALEAVLTEHEIVPERELGIEGVAFTEPVAEPMTNPWDSPSSKIFGKKKKTKKAARCAYDPE
jgi:hypothetical protein